MCLANDFGEKWPCYNGTVLFIYCHLSIGSLIHAVSWQGSPCRCQVRCLNPQGTQPSVQFTHSGWKYPRYATSGTLGAWRLPPRRQVKTPGYEPRLTGSPTCPDPYTKQGFIYSNTGWCLTWFTFPSHWFRSVCQQLVCSTAQTV